MNYIALARKWRPRTFTQLVGQNHTNKALINSLNQQRLHHAYLFTGTRGIGKTSVARLLAKALNCQNGISANPCLQCDACVAVEAGNFIDLIEVDAASRTRVEDTRELLENVQYSPVTGRYKIYLIDEVHMLSQHSFNALLKTLEEPPAHVKFLLATTDPQKLPLTILSRCLQFHLNPLPNDVICDHLATILTSEHILFDTYALTLLAKAARGSMRDALSLLDQVIISIEDKVDTDTVKDLLGYTKQDYALLLLQALAELAPDKMISLSREIASEGGQFQYVLEELLGYLHDIALIHHLPAHALLTPNPEMAALSQQFSPEDTQLFYQIGIKGLQDMQLAPTLAVGFEMTLLRLYAFRPAHPAQAPLLASQPLKQNPTLCKNSTTPEPSTLKEATEEPVITAEPILSAQKDWNQILAQLNLSGLALSAIENTELVSKNNKRVILRVDKGHQSLFTPAIIERIEQALSRYFKEPIQLELHHDTVTATPAQRKQVAQQERQQAAETALQSDPFFIQLKQEFAAEVVKSSIAPVQDDL